MSLPLTTIRRNFGSYELRKTETLPADRQGVNLYWLKRDARPRLIASFISGISTYFGVGLYDKEENPIIEETLGLPFTNSDLQRDVELAVDSAETVLKEYYLYNK